MTNATETTTATSSFLKKVHRRWHDGRTLLCVGLNLELKKLPTTHDAHADVETAFFSSNKAIIDATADLVCAYKPNAAFYERHSAAGCDCARPHHRLHPQQLSRRAGAGGRQAGRYRQHRRGLRRPIIYTLGADAVTLHPYLGGDALQPFLKRADRGCFILAHTSNPGADEFQHLTLRTADGAEEPLYLAVARTVAERWNTNGNCGLVVGATYPEQLEMVRQAAGDLPLLIPGIGARAAISPQWSMSGWIARARGCSSAHRGASPTPPAARTSPRLPAARPSDCADRDRDIAGTRKS